MAIPFQHVAYIHNAEGILSEANASTALTITDPTNAPLFFARVDPGFNATLDHLTLSFRFGVIGPATSVTGKWQINPQGGGWQDIPNFTDTRTWGAETAIEFYDVLTSSDFTGGTFKAPFDVQYVITASPGTSQTYQIVVDWTGNDTVLVAHLSGDSE